MDIVKNALRIAKEEGGAATGAGFDPAAFVSGLYANELGRSADPGGLNYWVNEINTGSLTPEKVAESFAKSSENVVQDLYQQNLGRAGDPSGMAYWQSEIESGRMTPEQVSASMRESSEYQKLTGGGKQPVIKQPGQQQYYQQGAGTQPVDISVNQMPLVYVPPPYPDYGATAAAYRVASGLENLPAPFGTLSPVVGGTPDSGGGTGDGGAGAGEGGGAGGGTGGGAGSGTGGGYQNILNKLPVQPPKPPTGFTSNTNANYINNLYKTTFGRAPDAAGLKYWTSQIQSGAMSAADVKKALEASPEATQAKLESAYKQYLDRSADKSGMKYWQDQIATGKMTLGEAINAIAKSPEATKSGLGGAGAKSAVSNAYEKYLGRKADKGGAAYWENQIASGNATVADVERAIANSPEAIVREAYEKSLGRDPDAGGAQYWADQIASGTMTASEVANAIAQSPEALGRADGGAVPGYADGGSTNYEDLVRAAYQEFLGRDPEAEGLAYWAGELESGSYPASDFERIFKGSTYEDDVRDAYLKYLNREPDPSGLDYWQNQLKNNQISVEDFINAIQNSPEKVQEQQRATIPTPDRFSELQGGREYDINIGNVERIPQLKGMPRPINVKEEFENSEIERLKKELDAAKAAAMSGAKPDFGSGGGGGEGGSNFGAGDPSGTSGAIQSDPGGGPQGPGMDSSGASGVGEGTGGLWARGGRTSNDAITNALRMIKADRH